MENCSSYTIKHVSHIYEDIILFSSSFFATHKNEYLVFLFTEHRVYVILFFPSIKFSFPFTTIHLFLCAEFTFPIVCAHCNITHVLSRVLICLQTSLNSNIWYRKCYFRIAFLYKHFSLNYGQCDSFHVRLFVSS